LLFSFPCRNKRV